MAESGSTTVPESRLVALARQAGRLPPLWLTILIGVVMVVFGELLFGLPVFLATYVLTGQVPRAWGESFADSAVLSALYQTVALVVSSLGVYVIVWFWLRRYERRPFWTAGFERRGATQKVIRGAVVGVVMLGGAVALLAILGYSTPEDGPPQLQGSPALPGVFIALIG